MLKKIVKSICILLVLAIGIYAMEVIAFPKKTIEVNVELDELEDLGFVDVNFKLRANKAATGTNKDSSSHYLSDNEPIKIGSKFLEKGIALLLREDEFVKIDGKYIGNKLYLINNGDSDLCLSAQDSRLYLKMQAKNMFGKWQDIEYIPNSFCFFSYHEVCLAKGNYWEFKSPIFKGRHKTKLRYT